MSEFSRNLALVIGINQYGHGIDPLHNAVNDAKQLTTILREQHEYEVWVCLDKLATLDTLNDFLENKLPNYVTQDDRLLFYFAGHGTIERDDNDAPVGYLIPQDAKRGDVDTYLSMTQLQAALEKLPCRHFLGILDCCFAGAFRWGSMRDLLAAPEVIYRERYDRFIQDPAWQIIASAGSDQKAFDAFAIDTERGSGEHSPFAAALIKGLSGHADYSTPEKASDGIIIANELYMYLRDCVELATESRYHRQTPLMWSLKKHDKGEYIFRVPGHPLNLPPAPPLNDSSNPYRGLESYHEEHSDLFFGRTKLVEKLQNFVVTHPITVVLGASGSGKSSLVQAGLIPKLRKETTQQWLILPPIRPGKTPLQALNQGLRTAQLPEIAAQNPHQSLTMSIEVWAKQNPNTQLLLFIDQSEEIITLCQNENERQEFFQQILKAIGTHWDKLRVILSLRSDFEPQLRDAGLQFVPTVLKIGNTELKNRWHSGRFIVPAMTRGELREAIEQPAEKQVMNFQPHGLVEQLIDEVADMPGALPLLSFALSELYRKYLRRQRDTRNGDRSLTESDYQELGGVIESLTQRADQECEQLISENPAYAQIIRHVMLRMVTLGGGELARRQVPLSELEYPPEKKPLVKEVIDRLTNERLLVKGEDAEGNFYVEPAHDALVRSWQKLLNWVKEEKNLKLQRRLTPAALEWKSQQQAQFLWNADPYLEVLEKEVLKSENNWLNQVETEFVQRSVETKSFNTKRNWSFAIAVMLGLGSLAIAASIGQRNAQIAQIRALLNSSDARFTAAQEFDALLDSLRAESKLKALFPPSFDSQLKDLNAQFLQQAVYGVKESNRLKGSGTPLGWGIDGQISWNRDGQTLAFVSGDQTVKLWKQDRTEPQILKGYSSQVAGVSWSPDGQILATVAQDGTVKLWKSDGSPLNTFKVDGGPIGISWSPDGELLAIPCINGIQLRQRDGTLPTFKNSSIPQSAFSVSWNPKQPMFASSGQDGKVHLWNRDGTRIKSSNNYGGWVFGASWHPGGRILAIAVGEQIKLLRSDLTELETVESKGAEKISWSPDGQTLATGGGQERTVKLWQWDGKRLLQIATFRSPTPIASLKWSLDGQTLATLDSGDGTVRLWKNNPLQLTLNHHSLGVNAASLSPDGRILATASEDTTVKLWTQEGDLLKTLNGSNSFVKSVSWSPNGQILATGDYDSVKLWTRKGTPLTPPIRHSNYVHSVSWSPNGQILASGAGDHRVKLWKRDGAVISPMGPFPDWVEGVNWSPDGQILAVAVKNSSVFLHEPDGDWIKTLDKAGNTVSWNPDGQTFATSGGNTIKLWNRDGTSRKWIPAGSDGVGRIAWHPKGKIFAATSLDMIKLWKPDGTLLMTLKGHTDKVNSITWSSDGQTLVSASNDRTVKLWQLDDDSDNQLLDDLQEQSLREKGCNWMRDYLKNNPSLSESDRRLCDN